MTELDQAHLSLESQQLATEEGAAVSGPRHKREGGTK